MSFHDIIASPNHQNQAPTTSGLMVQRKCACGTHTRDGECDECRKRRMLQRSDRGQHLLSRLAPSAPVAQSTTLGPAQDFSGLSTRGRGTMPALRTVPRLQRQLLSGAPAAELETPAALPSTTPAAPTPTSAPAPTTTPETIPEATPAATPETTPETTATTPPASLIADDSATDLQPGQLRQSDFLDRLHSAVCAEAEAALAGTEHSTTGCPYLAQWFAYYRGQSSDHVEGALRRYAPEARAARTAAEYIPLVAARVRQGVERWARTGEITGVPEGVPLGLPGGLGGLASGIGSLLFMARDGGARAADDPAAVQAELGSGTPLASGVRSRMESAFGQSFAHVRTHTGTTAQRLSSEQNARAFTVGRHVAFGSSEYRPGTLVGDALIAHELAHVVQQGSASERTQAKATSGVSYGALEREADDAAVGAVASLWGGAKGALASAVLNMKSGLRLSRCKEETCESGNKTIDVDLVKLHGSNRSPSTDLTKANNIFKGCCVKFNKVKEPKPESKAVTEGWLGGDTDLNLTGITCSSPTAEEKSLYDKATSKHSLSSQMRIFYVEKFSGYNALAFSRPPYCAGGYANHAVLHNGALKDTLAHEFGHILLNADTHSGIDNPADKKNLMFAPGRTGSDLDASQCKTIYNNA